MPGKANLNCRIVPFLAVLNTITIFAQNRNYIYDMQNLIERNSATDDELGLSI
jgi:hypothetical protein